MPDQSISLAPRSVLPVMSHGAPYHAFTSVARTFAVPTSVSVGALATSVSEPPRTVKVVLPLFAAT